MFDFLNQYEMSVTGTSIETENKLMIVRAEGKGIGEQQLNEYGISFGGVTKMF